MASAPTVVNVCACCKGDDGIFRFVCRCGFQASTKPQRLVHGQIFGATGCPKCGAKWEFEGKAA